MVRFPSIATVLIGSDSQMRRLAFYWAVTMMLYATGLLVPRFGVRTEIFAER